MVFQWVGYIKKANISRQHAMPSQTHTHTYMSFPFSLLLPFFSEMLATTALYICRCIKCEKKIIKCNPRSLWKSTIDLYNIHSRSVLKTETRPGFEHRSKGLNTNVTNLLHTVSHTHTRALWPLLVTLSFIVLSFSCVNTCIIF